MTRPTCVRTVAGDMTSSSAISSLLMPRPTRLKISRSRSVRPSTAAQAGLTPRGGIGLHQAARDGGLDQRIARRDDAHGAGQLVGLDVFEENSLAPAARAS